MIINPLENTNFLPAALENQLANYTIKHKSTNQRYLYILFYIANCKETLGLFTAQ